MERGANRQEPVWIRIWLICFLCRNGGNMEQMKKIGENHMLQKNGRRRGSAENYFCPCVATAEQYRTFRLEFGRHATNRVLYINCIAHAGL